MQSAECTALPVVVRGSGPGLVLVHGGGATPESTYGPVIGSLARSFGVVAPDYSQPASDTTTGLDQLADLHVEAAVQAGHTQFAMVGHSLGSMIAVRAALRHPDRVTGLVLTAGFAYAAMSTRVKVQLWQALLNADRDVLARYLMTVMFSDRYLSAMTQDQVDGFAELIGLGLRDGTPEQIDLVLSMDLRPELASVAVPTLVIAAKADQLVPAWLSAELAAGIRGAAFVELDCGHQPALECAGEWARLIGDFCLVRASGQGTK